MARRIWFAVLFAFVSTAAASPDNLKYGSPSDDGEVVNRQGYALSYNEDHEQASWVSYKLTRGEVRSNKVKRKGSSFKSDPDIQSGSANRADYRGSGYDRGHLAPAADMKWSKTAMDECFYYSNMSPQYPSFNRGIWKRLEQTIRDFAEQLVSIYVVTGPVLQDGLPAIGGNEVSIPENYYKCVLYAWGDNYHAIGFLLPNEGSDKTPEMFAVTIDEVEETTGLDFFNQLPDSVEENVESNLELYWWFND